MRDGLSIGDTHINMKSKEGWMLMVDHSKGDSSLGDEIDLESPSLFKVAVAPHGQLFPLDHHRLLIILIEVIFVELYQIRDEIQHDLQCFIVS